MYFVAIIVGYLCYQGLTQWVSPGQAAMLYGGAVLAVSVALGVIQYALAGHGFWKGFGTMLLAVGVIPTSVICLVKYGIVPLWRALA